MSPYFTGVSDMHHPALQVLVVEDHAETARNLRQLLTAEGHAVQVASDGRSAVELAATGKPDVALIDLGLPGGMDGYQVARVLREQADDRWPLLVVITGNDGADSRDRSCQEGIDLHMTKPAQPETINKVLRRFADILWPPEVE
jgi:two-component system OmpR family response regulator